MINQCVTGHSLPSAEHWWPRASRLVLHPNKKLCNFVILCISPRFCVFQMSLNPSWKGYLATTSWPSGASTSTGGTTGTCRPATSCCRATWKPSARRSSALPANSLASVSGVGTIPTTSCLEKGTFILHGGGSGVMGDLAEPGLGPKTQQLKCLDTGCADMEVWGKISLSMGWNFWRCR